MDAGKKIKSTAVVAVALMVVLASQLYPRYHFTKYSGIDLPAFSLAIKWSSDTDDFFAAFLVPPGSVEELVGKEVRGKAWRNDTLDIKLRPTRRNVPFFDILGNELSSPDSSRWFVARFRQRDPGGYLQKGYAVIAYPSKGLIFISAGD